MTQKELTSRAKSAAKRVTRAERELDKATVAYDKVRSLADKHGLEMPRTILTNPLL